MKVSAIIPAYNVDQYLADCIDSLLCQDIDMEIIIINDGSSDKTGDIAEQYKNDNKNIRVIHQTNKGLSAARNKGLEIAKGEYIVFVDSDDWLTKGVLNKLYNIASENQADLVMGNITLHYPDGSESDIFDISSPLKNRIFTGPECFISLMEAHSYYPMVVSYIYKHEWIKKNNLRFVDGIIHEDEAWTPIALCMAGCVILTDLDFYHYRKREGSIMCTVKREIRIHSYFCVIDRLLLLAEKYNEEEEYSVLRSWIYVNIFRIIKTVYEMLSITNTSTCIIPKNNVIDIYNQIRKSMPSNAKERCESYYSMAKASEEKYQKWENNPWDKYISHLPEQELQSKKIILIYNNPEGHDYDLLSTDKCHPDYIITLDRKYMNQAYAIVFYLPDLLDHLEDDLEKPENQIWVAWSTGDEENDPWAKDEDFRNLFDIWMPNYDIYTITNAGL